MLTLRHIKGSNHLKQSYGLHRTGELDHQDASFEGPRSTSPKSRAPESIGPNIGDVVEVDVIIDLESRRYLIK